MTHHAGAQLQDILQKITEGLVDDPDQLQVTMTSDVSDRCRTVVFTVQTGPGDTGKVIGVSGRNAQAIRILLEAIASKHRHKVILDILDDPEWVKKDGR